MQFFGSYFASISLKTIAFFLGNATEPQKNLHGTVDVMGVRPAEIGTYSDGAVPAVWEFTPEPGLPGVVPGATGVNEFSHQPTPTVVAPVAPTTFFAPTISPTPGFFPSVNNNAMTATAIAGSFCVLTALALVLTLRNARNRQTEASENTQGVQVRRATA